MTIYLYTKQCTHCKLKYFGKTKQANPHKYKGSGMYWKRHLRYYKANQITIELWSFKDQSECTKFALKFSRDNNIVESKDWANLQYENGVNGGIGRIITKEQREKASAITKKQMSQQKYKNIIRESNKNRKLTNEQREKRKEISKKLVTNNFMYSKKGKHISDDHRKKIIESNKTRIYSDETKRKISESKKYLPKYECQYCKNIFILSMHTRWHGHNCKQKPKY